MIDDQEIADMGMPTQTATLRKWRLLEHEHEGCLLGDAFNHPELFEGAHLLTARLIYIRFHADGTVTARTQNTLYTLEEPL